MSKRIEELEKEIRDFKEDRKSKGMDYKHIDKKIPLRVARAKLEERKLAEEEFEKMIDEIKCSNHSFNDKDNIFYRYRNCNSYNKQFVKEVCGLIKEELKQKLNQGEGK